MASPGDLDVSIRISADGSQAIVNLQRVDGSLGEVGRSAANAGQSISGFGRALAGMAAAAVGVASLDAMVTGFTSANVEAGRLRAALETVTGSVRGASDAWSEMTQFAKETPFDLAQSVDGFIKLKALGLDPTVEAMRSYGNTASSMGKSMTDIIEAVADATTGEFERLKEFGIKASKSGEQVALTFQGVTKTIGNSAKEVEAYIRSIGNNEFAGAMERQMKTLGGAISNVQDAMTQFWVAVGDKGLTDAASGALQNLGASIEGVTAALGNGDLDGWIAGLQAGAGAVGAVTAAYLGLSVAAGAARVAVAALNIALTANPFVLLATAAVALGGAIYAAQDAMIEFGGVAGTVGDLAQAAWEVAAETLGGPLLEAISNAMLWVQNLGIDFGVLGDVITESAANAARNLVNSFLDAVRIVSTIAAGIVTAFRRAFTDVQALASAFMTDLGNFDFGFAATKQAAVDAARGQLSNLRQVVDESKAIFTGGRDYVGEMVTQAGSLAGQVKDRFKDISLDRQLDEAIAQEQQLSGAKRAGAAAAKAAAEAVTGQAGATEKLTKAQQAANAELGEYAARAARVLSGLNQHKTARDEAEQVARYTARIKELLPVIDQMGQKHGVSREMILALMETESEFAANARSPAGAIGLMQLMPATAAEWANKLGLVGNAWKTNVNDNIEIGAAYFAWLVDQFEGDMNRAIMAYNGGIGNIKNGIIPEETRKYLPQVLGNVNALTTAAGKAGEPLRKDLADGLKKTADKAREADLALADMLANLGDRYGTEVALHARARQGLAEIGILYSQGAMSADEYRRALQNIRLEYQESQGPMAAYFAGLERDLQDGFENIGVQAMDGFINAIADGLVDGRFEFDDFVDDVKRSLARLAVNTIVVNIVGNLIGLNGAGALQGALGQASGVLGTGGAVDLSTGTLSKLASLIGGNSFGANAAALLAKGAGMLGYQGSGGFGASIAGIAGTPNWAYGLGGIGGSLLGTMLFGGKGYSGIGSSVGSLGGSIGGAALSGALGLAIPGIGAILGGLLGGIAGGGLGSLFGGDKTPRQGSFATSFSGYGFEDNAKAKGAFGLNFGLDDRYSKNIDGAQFQDFYDGMAQVSNTLAQFYGTDLATKVQVKLRESLGDFKGYGPDAASAFQEIFQRIIDAASQAEGDVGEGMGRLMKVAIGALSGSTEDMANQIESGMAKVKATIGLFDSDIGKLLGMGTGLYYADMEQAIAGLTGYVARFREGAETVPETIERIVTVVGTLKSAVEIAGQAIENLTGDELIRISQQFTDAMASMGMSLQDLSSLQATYFDKFFTAEEKALKQRDAALAGIEAWNRQLGLSGEAMIDSSAEFRKYIESLNLLDPAQQAAYLSAMNMIGAFVSLDEALAALKGTADGAINSVKDFVDSIKPDEIKQADALKEMVDLFAKWGMQLPPTADALYALIQAGALNEKQIQALADKSDVLSLAWAALAAAQEAALKELQAAYDDAVAKAKEASQARIEALREESAARIDALRDAYDDQVKAATKAHQELIDGLNDKLADAREALAIFQRVVESANDALRSLTEQTDGIDETRQRALAEARKALEDYKKTGKLPDNITDIIGGLGTVDPNDFASREDWLKAVAENKRIIEELKKIGVDGKSEAERQIELIEAQIEQANKQHEALLESLRENLDKAIKAEQDNLDKLIKAEEDALKAQLAALQAEFEKAKEDLMIDTNKLVAEANARLKEILDAILAGQKPVQPLPKDDKSESLAIPGFAAGGRHAGGLRIVGEMGPELEYTGPSVVAPNNGIAGLFRAGNSDIVMELRASRDELRGIRSSADGHTKLTQSMLRLLQRWDGEGVPPDREDFLKAMAEAAA